MRRRHHVNGVTDEFVRESNQGTNKPVHEQTIREKGE
jgi:hypothetical protein